MFAGSGEDMLPTALGYASAKPKATIYRLKDSPNLFLVVYPSGRKSWEYRYQDKGLSKALILGAYGERRPALGPKAARQERDRISTDRAKGIDPVIASKLRAEEDRAALVAKKAARERGIAEKAAATLAKAKGGITVKAMAEEWIAANRPHWSRGHTHQIEQSLADHAYPKLGAMHPEKVEPAHILDLIGGMLADGLVETARRVRQRLDAVFERACLRYGFRSNPVALSKRELSKLFKVAAKANPEEHFPAVPVKDIPQLLRAMRSYTGTPVTFSLLWFVCLTGCRTGEARGATWDEFDFKDGTWTIPAKRMKAARGHTVYLAPAVVDLLQALKPNTRGLPWVFPHPTRNDKPVSENAVLYALASIGFKDRHSGHGFRRMFSTLANDSGLFRGDVIEAALAHKEGDAVREAYNAATYQAERRRLAHWYPDELARLESAAPAKVVAIR
jgi:integrase